MDVDFRGMLTKNLVERYSHTSPGNMPYAQANGSMMPSVPGFASTRPWLVLMNTRSLRYPTGLRVRYNFELLLFENIQK